MRAVTTSLAERATSIFDDLGYSVSKDGSELLAKRKWRVVRVTLSKPDIVPTSGDFRCFVTRTSAAEATRRRVEKANPAYEWAVIAVDEDGEYEVLDGPAGA